MAELLVRIVDKINEDFYLNLQCSKKGDVIVVCPDDWAWGKEEVSSPNWTIIKIPGVPVDEFWHLCAPEINTDSKNPSKTLQKRMFKLDLDAMPKTGLDLKVVTDATMRKEVVADPAIFGDSPNVF